MESSLPNIDIAWKPFPKQALFLACPVFEVLFGGSKGPGKTACLLVDHVGQHRKVHQAWETHGYKTTGRALLIRKDYNRLKEIMNRAEQLLPVISGGRMRYREQQHTWTCLDCGYKVEFGHLEGPRDHQLYQGNQFSYMGFDQAEEIPFEQYAYLKLQVRSTEPALVDELKVRLTANPLGRYVDWVKKRFIDPYPDGLRIIEEVIKLPDGNEVRRERCFIPSLPLDNPLLPPGYIAEMMAAPDHMRRAFLYGDWNVVAGSFFGDVWNPDIHIIDDLGPTEIRIPSNWPVFRCADWGARSPAPVYWIAVDNDGLLIVLDELYCPGENATVWSKKILAIEERWGWLDSKGFSKLQGFIDPSATKATQTGAPIIADQCFEMGINWYPGDNDRKSGWAELRRRLMERGGIGGKIPGLRVTRRCINLIRTLPNLTAPESPADGDMDDIADKQDDHAVDAIRYGIMSRPMVRAQKDVEEEEIRRWERIELTRQMRSQSARNSTTGY